MRTFGIEIEAFGLSLQTAASAIRAAGVECIAENYGHSVPRNWKVVTDCSIDGQQGFEVVSPILSGEEGIAQVRAVMNALAGAGAKVNKSTGLHVHVGARDFTIREFKNIARNYMMFEDFFDAIMPVSRRANNNGYIKSNRARFGGYTADHARRGMDAVAACTTIDQIIQVVNGTDNSARYHKLNLTAFYRHGTVEFRQHSGSVDAEKAVNWVRLLLAFVDRAATTQARPRKVGAAPKSSVVFKEFFQMFPQVADLKAFYVARRDEFAARSAAAQ